jgi:hypothetical protein
MESYLESYMESFIESYMESYMELYLESYMESYIKSYLDRQPLNKQVCTHCAIHLPFGVLKLHKNIIAKIYNVIAEMTVVNRVNTNLVVRKCKRKM